jgi:UDPglucose 6-dehydrogenase
MDNACIIGYGMVGKATAEVFGITKIFTKKPEDCNITLEQASKCRFVFICLPTPIDKDGNYILNDIKEIIRQMEEFGNGPIYIIRSTVFPGFAVGLQKELRINTVISNPEFLSEDTALQDAKNPPFVLIGGLEGTFRSEVKAFYEARLKGSPIIETDNTSAEMAKLAMNAYFATKVIFANELSEGCRLVKANYSTVKKVLESHPYGPMNHFKVWYKNRRGVHGSCLPKDTKAFANYAYSDLVKLVIQLNEKYIYMKEDDEI